MAGNNIHMGVGQASNAINVMKGISTGYVYFAAWTGELPTRKRLYRAATV